MMKCYFNASLNNNEPIANKLQNKIKLTLTSTLALFWNIVCALWVSCAKQELRVDIFCLAAYTISGSSLSNSPEKKKTEVRLFRMSAELQNAFLKNLS